MLAAVDQAVEREHASGRVEPVRQLDGQGQLGPDPRLGQLRLRDGHRVSSFIAPLLHLASACCLGREACRQRVAQQHDVPDRPYLGEGCPAARVEREPAGPDEPVGARVPDEERRHDELQLVGEVGGEELRVHAGAALHHQPSYAAPVQVLAEPPHVHPSPAVDHRGQLAEPSARPADRPAGAVDDLVAVPGREEGGARIQVGPPGDRDLDGRRREVSSEASAPELLRADQQPRVVVTHGPGADQDGVALGADRVDAGEVVGVGQLEPLVGPRVEVAVDRQCTAEQRVGTVSHGAPPEPAWRREAVAPDVGPGRPGRPAPPVRAGRRPAPSRRTRRRS